MHALVVNSFRPDTMIISSEGSEGIYKNFCKLRSCCIIIFTYSEWTWLPWLPYAILCHMLHKFVCGSSLFHKQVESFTLVFISFSISQETSWPWMILVKWWRRFWMWLQSGTNLDCSSNWRLEDSTVSKLRFLILNASSWRCSRFGWPPVTIPAGRFLQMLSGVEVWEQVNWPVFWRQSTAWRRKLKWTVVHQSPTASLRPASPLLPYLSRGHPFSSQLSI